MRLMESTSDCVLGSVLLSVSEKGLVGSKEALHPRRVDDLFNGRAESYSGRSCKGLADSDT